VIFCLLPEFAIHFSSPPLPFSGNVALR